MGTDVVPPNPRRLLRNLATSREERQVGRDQRRLEVERELREKLGLDDSISRTGTPESVDGDRPASARPLSSSRRRAGESSCAAGPTPGGPPRPPKPKPHRPLNLAEESPTVPAAAPPPSTRRWKSALLPLWHDRDGPLPTSDLGNDKDAAAPSPTSVPETELRSKLVVAEGAASRPVLAESPCALSLDDSQPTRVLADVRQLPSKAGSPRRVLGQTSSDGQSSDIRAHQNPPSDGLSLSVQTCPVDAFQEPLVGSAERGAIASAATVTAVSALEQRRLHDEMQSAKRAKELEESAQRLRSRVASVRVENRRSRLFTGQGATESVDEDPSGGSPKSARAVGSTATVPPESSAPSTSRMSSTSSRRLEEMKRKIAELDEINEIERERLESEQREVEQRRRAQEEFERTLQQRTERDIREHKAKMERAEKERLRREEEEELERKERGRRRQEQLLEEKERSKRLEEKRTEGRSETSQLRWHVFEEELDRHWAQQEVEEKRRINEFAKQKSRMYEDWDRRLTSERAKFASDAEVNEAARHRKARNAAHADENFYGQHRYRMGGNTGNGRAPSPSNSQWVPPRPPPAANNVAGSSVENLNPEERAVLKELQTVRSAARDSQKAKVKELLLRWHPDKNPTCAEKATRVFQFVQKQRELILGL